MPALMLHSVSKPVNAVENKYNITPTRFKQFASWLSTRGYECLRPEDLLRGKRPARPVILTFDDGYEDFYTHAFPVLDRLKLSATVFVVVNRIGKSNIWDGHLPVRLRPLMNAPQIRELHRLGVTFGSHSLTHPFLTQLRDQDLHREVSISKSRLEDLLGSEVTGFSYPSGRVDDRVRAAVAEAGYKTAVSTRPGLNFGGDPFWIRRTGVSALDTFPSFLLKVISGKSVSRHLLECLVWGVRSGIDVLPDATSRFIRPRLHKTFARWWAWKETGMMRQLPSQYGTRPFDI